MKKLALYFLLLLLPASVWAQQPDTLRVLCIGNSFTYFYDSHVRLTEIAASEGHTILMTAAYVGGYTFYRHMHDVKSIKAIEEALYVGAYDCAFLQDQSQAFARYGENPKQYRLQERDTRELVQRVRMYSPKARIWLEQTWSYPAGNCGGFGTMEQFDACSAIGAKRLAKQNKTAVSPIAEAFAIVRQEREDIDLYEPDRKHQSLAGTYLKSCVNYLLIFGQPFSENTADCQLNHDTALYLRSVAMRVVMPKKK